MPLAFSGYCDFETYMEPIQGCALEPTRNPGKYSWIKFEQESIHCLTCTKCTETSACSDVYPLQVHGRHIVYAYGLKLECFYKGYGYDEFPLIIEYGESDELMERFLVQLKEYCVELYQVVNSPIPIIMTDEDKQEHEEATNCKYCHREFDDEKVKKIADHCHLRGVYR